MKIRAEDYDKLRQAGRINGAILAALRDAIQVGMQTRELDEIAQQMLKEAEAEAPFLGFPPNGKHPYPATINVSINDELVHGIPGKRIIQNGDVVTLDCGTQYQGLIADSAITVIVGEASPKAKRLIQATEEALALAIKATKPGRTIGDVAFVIQTVLRKYRVNIPPQYGGHGVGYALHAPPHVPNWGKPHKGMTLEAGMALAIEPMGMFGRPETRLMPDHWTVKTLDGSICAHSEHTVLITEGGAEIMTPVPASTKEPV